jgi:hypothetical protein
VHLVLLVESRPADSVMRVIKLMEVRLPQAVRTDKFDPFKNFLALVCIFLARRLEGKDPNLIEAESIAVVD